MHFLTLSVTQAVRLLSADLLSTRAEALKCISAMAEHGCAMDALLGWSDNGPSGAYQGEKMSDGPATEPFESLNDQNFVKILSEFGKICQNPSKIVKFEES